MYEKLSIFDGGKQRNIITHMPRIEIYELAHYENDKRNRRKSRKDWDR